MPYTIRECLRHGWLERAPIEGRGPTKWQPHGTRQMLVQRPRSRWAYRITHAGLDWLERLRNGERDVIGRRRSRNYQILSEWMPGRGPMPRAVVNARLGRLGWKAIDWVSANYGNPWPVYGRPGWWEWREWTREELWS